MTDSSVSATVAGESPAGGASYTYVDIGKIPGAHVTVPFSMNNHANLVGWGQGPGSQVRAILWTPQTGIQEFPLPAGFDSGYATDISHTGIIVGTAYNGIGRNQARAWRWVDGVHELLPPSINERRQVTGYGIYVVTGPDLHRAFRFTTEGGLDLLRPYPGPSRSAGYGINENGDVIGNSGTTSAPDATAWLWTEQGGRVNLIDLLAPEPGLYGVSSGQDINDLGQMIARAITDDPYGAAIVLTPPAAQ